MSSTFLCLIAQSYSPASRGRSQPTAQEAGKKYDLYRRGAEAHRKRPLGLGSGVVLELRGLYTREPSKSRRPPAPVSECGDSSPLSLAATRCGDTATADESAAEKAGASSRTPKFRTPGTRGE